MPEMEAVAARRPKHPLDRAFSDEANAVMAQAGGPKAALQGLIDAELLPDTLVFLSRSLPANYLVGWVRSCMAYEMSAGWEPDPAESEIIVLVDYWYQSPSEDLRRQALDAAEALQYGSAPAWLAALVGWSGGSIGPPDLDQVDPAPHAAGTAALCAISELSLLQPEHLAEHQKAYIDNALKMLQGGSN